MTYPKYTQQDLSRYNLPRLKRIAAELGITPTGDKRAADTWVNAIIAHQSTKLHKVTDSQALAQAELDDYIANQAQAIAPEPLTTKEISFYDHEIYSGNHLIATISHDDDLTQPWVVMVEGKEKFRANTYARCHRFIQWHHQDSTLSEPLPTQTQTPPTTENRIMAHIFNECQKYGFEILDDGIYNSNGVKLGQVGCTNGNWWVILGSYGQQQYSNSVFDAVRSLSMVDVSCDDKSIFDEYFLEQPLEQLTGNKLQRLLERAELVTA
ncbi:hypothetical protein FD724_32745 (plasmid) [Nostoc sp. C057]|uniref:hypothetical protein n=1 Tax=Nostoc sp. C057 TaxID=2576903 RepID=UPI0015C40074|nr:hypothetical protein [Nostoc sp. C057]QLE52734.1 hypothetical protein FD724_32745 [Nostoc sp. C057]